MSNETEDEDVRVTKDRRQRTPYDWVSGLGGPSSAVIGVFLIQMIGGLSDQVDTIRLSNDQNSRAVERVAATLGDMKKEFGLDIQDFQIKHRALKTQLDACERQQLEMMRNMGDIKEIERAIEQWQGLEQRLKLWAENTFQKRK